MRSHNKIAMVVDDDEIFRYAIARLIKSYGWEAHEAGGREEATRLFRDLSPRITLLDLQMPPPDGFETCAAMRAQCDSPADCIIIAVSGLARHSVEERALRSGFNTYLLKPISENLLRGILEGAER